MENNLTTAKNYLDRYVDKLGHGLSSAVEVAAAMEEYASQFAGRLPLPHKDDSKEKALEEELAKERALIASKDGEIADLQAKLADATKKKAPKSENPQ